MPEPNSQADLHLLALIRDGDQDGWAQFVSRYQGRMLAFARQQIGAADAEDLVQEAFVAFLKSLSTYRGESQLESWMFRILRRRIIDHYRATGKQKELSACSIRSGSENFGDAATIEVAVSPGDSPSMHASLKEQHEDDRRRLLEALSEEVNRLKMDSNLRDLMILEGVFYANIKNRELSKMLDVDEGKIAVVRHRILKRMKSAVEELRDQEADKSEEALQSNLLTSLWEQTRPSCPKRTTLGKSLLGILEPVWQEYIVFHVDTIGCRYCAANRNDLALPREDEVPDASKQQVQRIFESTVGFI